MKVAYCLHGSLSVILFLAGAPLRLAVADESAISESASSERERLFAELAVDV
jgi:hypothetical protein